MTSYRELRRKILSLLSQPPYKYNIPYLARILGVDRTTIHHIIRPLIRKGIIIKEVYDGLSWISLHHKTLYEYMKREVDFAARKRSIVDLINKKRVSQTSSGICEKDLGKVITPAAKFVDRSRDLSSNFVNLEETDSQKLRKDPSCSSQKRKIRLPSRVNIYRAQALKLLLRRRQLTIDDWVLLSRLFNAYLEDTQHRVILLFDEYEEKTLWLPYKHRFTKSGIKRLLRRFHSVFDKANNYHVGVWLTLTVDPKKYSNALEMRYAMQDAWNRFMSWLNKKLGKRPQYIRVIEFTKSGLIHFHVLLLGVKRIGDKFKEITPELVRAGFGKISFMYVVVNRNGRWIPKKLLELKEGKSNIKADGAGLPSNLRSYLKKYLTKALSSLMEQERIETDQENPVVLYWALNARFFTYSRQLKPDPEIDLNVRIVIGNKEYSYKFLGSGYIVDPGLLPLETNDPPWNYHVENTFPPLYDPGLVL